VNLTGQYVNTTLLGRIQIGREFARGGEGIIYEIVGHNGYLLKVYCPDVPPDKLEHLYTLKRQAYQLFARIKFSKTEELRCLPLEYVRLTGNVPAYLMRRAQGTLLTNLFTDIKQMVLEDRLVLSRALAQAITQLHGTQIVQSDIKPSNYIVERRGNGWVVYVLDIDGGGYFGPQAKDFAPSTVPLQRYGSPELLQQNWIKLWDQPELRKQPDLWALAVLLYQIIVDADGPLPTRPSKSPQVTGYVPYHSAAVIAPQINWPQPWQKRQMEEAGLDDLLIDRFTYVFGNQRLKVESNRRPEAQDWRYYLDRVLHHRGYIPQLVSPVSSSNGRKPVSRRVGGNSSGNFFNRVRRWMLGWKQRFVVWADG
jgi:serine/threonine protein kinase